MDEEIDELDAYFDKKGELTEGEAVKMEHVIMEKFP